MKKTITKEVKNKLQKILALAEKGSEGEKITAQKLLDELLKKYELTLEDIAQSEEEKKVEIYLSSEMEFNLLSQIIYKVKNVSRFSYWKFGKRYIIKCTENQRIEINNQFEFYNKLFKKEYTKEKKKFREDFFKAYIYKHKIWCESNEEENNETADSQPIDLDRLQRIYMYKKNMSNETYYKKLER